VLVGGANTTKNGMVARLRAGDYYAFSAASGGKHCELSVTGEDTNIIYIWFMPGQLYLPPTLSSRSLRFPSPARADRAMVGDADGVLPIPNDIRVSRLVADSGSNKTTGRARGRTGPTFS
jgi:quercetin 2,3-dioxygenase